MNTAIQKINTQLNTMSIDKTVLTKNASLKAFVGIFAFLFSMVGALRPAFADEPSTDAGISAFFTKATTITESLNNGMLKIVTPLAGFCIAVALVTRFTAKNPRTVEEATSWAKRIFVTYLILLVSSYILRMLVGVRNEVDDKAKDGMWTDDLSKKK